jgi:hypothetical protein
MTTKTKAPKKAKAHPGAVAKAWAIFNRHPKAERKDQLAKAVAAGINLNTAKTQLQIWRHASPAERARRVSP